MKQNYKYNIYSKNLTYGGYTNKNVYKVINIDKNKLYLNKNVRFKKDFFFEIDLFNNKQLDEIYYQLLFLRFNYFKLFSSKIKNFKYKIIFNSFRKIKSLVLNKTVSFSRNNIVSYKFLFFLSNKSIKQLVNFFHKNKNLSFFLFFFLSYFENIFKKNSFYSVLDFLSDRAKRIKKRKIEIKRAKGVISVVYFKLAINIGLNVKIFANVLNYIINADGYIVNFFKKLKFFLGRGIMFQNKIFINDVLNNNKIIRNNINENYFPILLIKAFKELLFKNNSKSFKISLIKKLWFFKNKNNKGWCGINDLHVYVAKVNKNFYKKMYMSRKALMFKSWDNLYAATSNCLIFNSQISQLHSLDANILKVSNDQAKEKSPLVGKTLSKIFKKFIKNQKSAVDVYIWFYFYEMYKDETSWKYERNDVIYLRVLDNGFVTKFENIKSFFFFLKAIQTIRKANFYFSQSTFNLMALNTCGLFRKESCLLLYGGIYLYFDKVNFLNLLYIMNGMRKKRLIFGNIKYD